MQSSKDFAVARVSSPTEDSPYGHYPMRRFLVCVSADRRHWRNFRFASNSLRTGGQAFSCLVSKQLRRLRGNAQESRALQPHFSADGQAASAKATPCRIASRKADALNGLGTWQADRSRRFGSLPSLNSGPPLDPFRGARGQDSTNHTTPAPLLTRSSGVEFKRARHRACKGAACRAAVSRAALNQRRAAGRGARPAYRGCW